MLNCSASLEHLFLQKTPSYTQITEEQGYYKTTADIFQRELHAYTITHAIEDRNVLRFLVEYYKTRGQRRLQAQRVDAQACYCGSYTG